MLPKHILVIALFGLVASACTSAPSPTATPFSVLSNGYPAPSSTGYPGPQFETASSLGIPQPPNEAPQPSPGKASAAGVFFSRATQQIVPGTLFYFAPAVGESGIEPPAVLGDPNVTRGDIIGTTDANGNFALVDIPPGNYYLFIWAPYDWRPAETGESDQSPRLITLQADQRAILGIVYVAWP